MSLNTVVIARTNHDRATTQSYPFLGGLCIASTLRGFDTSDICSSNFTRTTVENTISQKNPIFFGACGHGNADILCGYNNEVVLESCENDGILASKCVYLLSCSTAQRLGQTIIDKGGKAYMGYWGDFTWISETGTIYDKYAWGFMYSSTVGVILPLIAGKTFKEAYDNAVSFFDQFIEWWEDSNDPYAQEVVEWLIWDRDILLLYGDQNAKITDKIKVATPTDIIPPDKAGTVRIIIKTLYTDNTPAPNHPVVVSGLAYRTDGNGILVLSRTAPYSASVGAENLVNWEDGSRENPRTIQMTGASDVILVAYVRPSTLNILTDMMKNMLQVSMSLFALFTLMMTLMPLILMMRKMEI